MSESQVEELAAQLGYQDVPGHTREESFILASLLRRPMGLRSYRAVARAAGISPTTAANAIPKLESQGLIRRDRWRLLEGAPHEVSVWRANMGSPEWSELAPYIRKVRPKKAAGSMPAEDKVPRRLWHLFWNVDPSTLSVSRDGAYLAGRIMQSDDALALGWMERSIDPADIEKASNVRGLEPKRRALGFSLARKG